MKNKIKNLQQLKALILALSLSPSMFLLNGCANSRNAKTEEYMMGSSQSSTTTYDKNFVNVIIFDEYLESVANYNSDTTGVDDLLNLDQSDPISIIQNSNGGYKVVSFREAVSLLWRFNEYTNYLNDIPLKEFDLTVEEEIKMLGEYSSLHPDIMYTSKDIMYTDAEKQRKEYNEGREAINYPDYDGDLKRLILEYYTSANPEEKDNFDTYYQGDVKDKDKYLTQLNILRNNYQQFIKNNGMAISRELLNRVIKCIICNTYEIPISDYNKIDISPVHQTYQFTECYSAIYENSFIMIPCDSNLGQAIDMYVDIVNSNNCDYDEISKYINDSREISYQLTSNIYNSDQNNSIQKNNTSSMIKERKKLNNSGIR